MDNTQLQMLTSMKDDLTSFVNTETGRIKSLEDRLDRHEARGNRQGESKSGPALMETIQKSAGWAAIKSGQPTTGRMAVPLELKALTSTQAGGSPNLGYDVLPQRFPGIGDDPRRPLSVLDVLPSLPVSSNSFEFHQLYNYASGADYQATEGATKSDTDLPLTLRAAPICTVAHFIKASKQVLDDVPMLSMYLQELLLHGVRAKLESEIISGTTSGRISGLTTGATTFTSTASLAAADRISEAAAALEDAGWTPGLVIVKGSRWHKIRGERADDDQYVAGGWNQPARPNIWSLPVVTTPSMPDTSALVLDPSAVLVLDRMMATVQIGFDGNDFTQNLVTILAELRAGLAVISPSGVYEVSFA